MCRMFAYVGSSQEDLLRLFESLKKAAKEDKTWPGPGSKQHSDGWGCVIFHEGGLFHYRSKNPVFDDSSFSLPAIKGTAYAIFHARKASTGTPTGSSIFSHPFVAATNKATIFMSHNGGIKDNHPDRVDSELALERIAETGSLEAARDYLERITNSALNLFVLTIDRASKTAKLEYLNYWKPDRSDTYYQLYFKKLDGGKAVFSSTLSGDLGGEKCERGTVLKL